MASVKIRIFTSDSAVATFGRSASRPGKDNATNLGLEFVMIQTSKPGFGTIEISACTRLRCRYRSARRAPKRTSRWCSLLNLP